MLKGERLNFTYNRGIVNENKVLKDVSFEVNEGDFIGIIGSTGAGKTTLIKHFNGLLRADTGQMFFNGKNIYDKKYPLFQLRREVGIVFQYPEHQLFGKTVLADTMYGPLNLGMTPEQAQATAQESLSFVGICEKYYNFSPLELSGGQKRCVAIAGVLAMKPKILVLDEPAAGLDPETKDNIFELLCKIHREQKTAIIFVSHNMEDVANYCNRLWVFHEGTIFLDDTPQNIFTQVDKLKSIGIDVPSVTRITDKLKQSLPLDSLAITVDDAESSILKMFREIDHVS